MSLGTIEGEWGLIGGDGVGSGSFYTTIKLYNKSVCANLIVRISHTNSSNSN